ncbi:phosphate ABC transporter substrate-binding protein PstS [Yinghuangia sp. ASG 101]|uniref:phosphate ABC transporter substrate-binding protein PstS n=1 Tax=Yinghuangia sp. ASG 101 TaxID=2896848 RepID=UPI001E620DEA|nr:phosphate ABC transporter substrate-binding protein PstS [Yinghuangia sp. ASG 101]UGQ14925.1 phosphate ABC transporter substrate-binding protein PstS [Yinghuangia sp. ASG 101]
MTTRPRLARRSTVFAAVAVAGALTLTACGSDDNDSDSAGSSNSPAATSGGGSGGGGAPAADLACASGTLAAAGSSAQKNAIDEWAKLYQQKCSGTTINYNSNGSGAGRQAFFDGQVNFAGSDSALKDDEVAKGQAVCKDGAAINLPMVTGPIAVAYNLPGVKDLVLDAKTIAGIFSGKIKNWDAAEIKALNPNAQLPSTAIQTVHRSDKSGTTENFTKYLKAAAPADWTAEASQDWPSQDGQSAKGSEGVAGVVKQTSGAIGYMETSFAENNALGIAAINTGAAQPVKLTPEAAGKAVAAAQITGQGNDLKLQLDYATKAEGAYPIILVTYEIVCEKGTPADKLPLVKSFLTYTSSDEGQAILADNGYAPLPAEIAGKVRTAVAALS